MIHFFSWLVINFVVVTLSLYYGTRITCERIQLKHAAIVAMVGVLPWLLLLCDWNIISLVLLSYAITVGAVKLFSTVDQIWPDAILIVAVGSLVSYIFYGTVFALMLSFDQY